MHVSKPFQGGSNFHSIVPTEIGRVLNYLQSLPQNSGFESRDVLNDLSFGKILCMQPLGFSDLIRGSQGSVNTYLVFLVDLVLLGVVVGLMK